MKVRPGWLWEFLSITFYFQIKYTLLDEGDIPLIENHVFEVRVCMKLHI